RAVGGLGCVRAVRAPGDGAGGSGTDRCVVGGVWRGWVRDDTSRLPSFLYCTESISENLLFREHCGEPRDQRLQPLLRQHGDQIVPHATLTEQRMGAPFAGVRFQEPVITESLARRPEQSQQSDGQSV